MEVVTLAFSFDDAAIVDLGGGFFGIPAAVTLNDGDIWLGGGISATETWDDSSGGVALQWGVDPNGVGVFLSQNGDNGNADVPIGGLIDLNTPSTAAGANTSARNVYVPAGSGPVAVDITVGIIANDGATGAAFAQAVILRAS